MLDVTQYHITLPSVSASARLALISDLHDCPSAAVLSALETLHPQAILIAGDHMTAFREKPMHGVHFLREAIKICPVFYGLGNHEACLTEHDYAQIRSTGVHLLVNDSVRFREYRIGAIGAIPQRLPEYLSFVKRFSEEDGIKILISHRPEWYMPYLRQYPIPVIVSGHAHGGQIRLLGQPVFSPGQGLFPKYAQGVHEGRLIVSRGLGNHTVIPRLWNAPELCMITIDNGVENGWINK